MSPGALIPGIGTATGDLLTGVADVVRAANARDPEVVALVTHARLTSRAARERRRAARAYATAKRRGEHDAARAWLLVLAAACPPRVLDFDFDSLIPEP